MRTKAQSPQQAVLVIPPPSRIPCSPIVYPQNVSNDKGDLPSAYGTSSNRDIPASSYGLLSARRSWRLRGTLVSMDYTVVGGTLSSRPPIFRTSCITPKIYRSSMSTTIHRIVQYLPLSFDGLSSAVSTVGYYTLHSFPSYLRYVRIYNSSRRGIVFVYVVLYLPIPHPPSSAHRIACSNHHQLFSKFESLCPLAVLSQFETATKSPCRRRLRRCPQCTPMRHAPEDEELQKIIR